MSLLTTCDSIVVLTPLKLTLILLTLNCVVSLTGLNDKKLPTAEYVLAPESGAVAES